MDQSSVEQKTPFFQWLIDKIKNALNWKKEDKKSKNDFDDEVMWYSEKKTADDGVMKSDFFDKLIMKMHAPKLKDKTNFFRLLAVAQKAWLWLMESLNSLKLSEKNKWLYNIICDLMDQLSQWVNLADAMMNHDWFFGTNEIELVRSSQVSGNLVDTLYEIADELEASELIRAKVKKAMTYPIILLVVAIGATWALLVFALPNIVSMFSAESMPWITNVMLKVSDYMASWKWLLTIASIVCLVFLFKFLYGSTLFFKKFIDKLILTFPVSASAVKTYYMYQFAQLLSQFYSAWISPIVSLWLMANIFSNFEYKKKMIEIKKDMAAWFTFYESMDWSTLFDPVFIQIMHVWEDTWAIWEVLGRISKFYMNQFSDKMDTLMALLEPAMMVLMAGLIWSIVAAIYLPMVSVMEAL